MREIILLLILVFLLNGCIKEEIIGGERDSYGCLGAAGFSYDEEIKACIRSWELNENQRKAAMIAVKSVGSRYSLTVERVDVARCAGCFSVILNDESYNQIPITIDNWKIIEEASFLSPEECLSKGGRAVNIVDGSSCNENEENIGDVIGFISPNICCL